jgi:sec-independent protein translocase protein TatB
VFGLVVLGPERLPGVIRTGSLWLAKIRRSFNEVRAEIEREVQLDEIKRELHNQSIMDSLKDARQDLNKLRNLPYDVSDIVRDSDQQIREATSGSARRDEPDAPRQPAAEASHPASDDTRRSDSSDQ